jgi:hypothetical protein
MSTATLAKIKRKRKRIVSKAATSEAVIAPVIDLSAEKHERRIKKELDDQFQKLKDEAHALFGMVEGRPGVTSRAEWEKLLDGAGDDIGTGRFIVRCLGAERYLDAETVAVLVTLRQNLIAELGRTSTADMMMIDSAIIAYYNLIRAQRWIGDTALVVERELFGQAPLNEFQGATVGDRLTEQITRLAEGLIPLQERCQRMLNRSLAPLRSSSGRA